MRDDGTLWHKVNGVWTYTGVDLTGPEGTSVIPGDVAEGQSPAASIGKVGDIFFNLDGRVWEKTDDTTWTSRGDITGPPGSSLIPGVVAPGELPPSNVGNVGDTFLAADGRFWQKTDATTWTYIDDLTGPPGAGAINPRGEWATGNAYAVGDEVYRNFSFSKTYRILGTSITIPSKFSRAYLCKLAHTADANNAPPAVGTNDYWDALLGGDEPDDDDETGPVVSTDPITRYQLADSRPATPPSSMENPPAEWDRVARPPQHATLSIYQLVGTRTYDDDVFRSSVWAVTFVQGPIVPGPGTGLAVPSGLSLSATVSSGGKGGLLRVVSGAWAAAAGASGYNYEVENVSTGGSTSGSVSGTSFSRSDFGFVPSDSLRFRVQSTDASQVSAWSAWVYTTGGGIVVTTDPITPRYQLASSLPETPPTSVENPPAEWDYEQRPPQHATLSIYKLEGTRTYHDDVFHSTSWVVSFVEGPEVPIGTVTTVPQSVYRLASSTPAAPSGGTTEENHLPSGWRASKPDSTHTQKSYISQRTVTYEGGVFSSATVWGSPKRVEQIDSVYRRGTSTPATPDRGYDDREPRTQWLVVLSSSSDRDGECISLCAACLLQRRRNLQELGTVAPPHTGSRPKLG